MIDSDLLFACPWNYPKLFNWQNLQRQAFTIQCQRSTTIKYSQRLLGNTQTRTKTDSAYALRLIMYWFYKTYMYSLLVSAYHWREVLGIPGGDIAGGDCFMKLVSLLQFTSEYWFDVFRIPILLWIKLIYIIASERLLFLRV